jgi:cytoskeletal protein CcmA (bactofilin family)
MAAKRDANAKAAGMDAARGEDALTIVATGTRVVGEIQSNGVVKIEGEVAGTVRAARQVLVSRGGTVEGDIVTAEAVVGGEITGGVAAEQRVEVQNGAVINGDIATARLVVQEGGEVNGQIRMAGTEGSLDDAAPGPVARVAS